MIQHWVWTSDYFQKTMNNQEGIYYWWCISIFLWVSRQRLELMHRHWWMDSSSDLPLCRIDNVVVCSYHHYLVLQILYNVTDPRNWMCSKSLCKFLLILYLSPKSKVTIRIIIISVETSLSIIIVAHRTYYTFSFYIFQHN